MKPLPTDPMRQNDRFIAALCADALESGRFAAGPRAKTVIEIMHQLNTPREPGAGNSSRSDK